MSAQPGAFPPVRSVGVDSTAFASSASQSGLWNRVSTWASENKAAVYTIAGVTVLVTGAGVAYYLTDSVGDMMHLLMSTSAGLANVSKKPPRAGSDDGAKKLSKKERRKQKEALKKAMTVDKDAEKAEPVLQEAQPEATPKTLPVEASDDLPAIDETTVISMSPEDREKYALKLKASGNTAYGGKDYNKAIELYGKAIICKPDPIFYSNRAACYNALGEWEKVIEDTTAAINLDSEYVKALNRRANAYEHQEMFSEALLDFTASCIIDGFRNESSAQAVERLLKKVAEAKGKVILEGKAKRLPSPTFVTNYLQSFRVRPAPAGLDDSEEISEETGRGQLQAGLRSIAKKTAEGYEEAAAAFDKALELGDLGDAEAFAYNMRGTFKYLKGENVDALADLTKSVELSPALTQSFIKRASMHLELGKCNLPLPSKHY